MDTEITEEKLVIGDLLLGLEDRTECLECTIFVSSEGLSWLAALSLTGHSCVKPDEDVCANCRSSSDVK